MTAYKGSLMLIKVGNGGSPESFTTVGGLRTTRMALSNTQVENTTVATGEWRNMLSGAGIRALTVGGSGIFTDAAAEETVRSTAFSNQIRNYELYFGNGDKLAGAFHIASYERNAAHDSVENFSLTLMSASTITFTAA